MAESAVPELLSDGPQEAPLVVALAHGAGGPMDSPFMATVARGLAASGAGRWRVVRFEFPYMAARRAGGGHRPPDRQARLLETWRSVVDSLGPDRLVVGGKSLGGRMASMIADGCAVRGLVCLGYPFHPPGRPERLRTAHLEHLRTPTLIIQGTRDPFGGLDEVPGYALAPSIALHWIADGDHSLKPRASSGRTPAQALDEAVAAVAGFLARLEPTP